MGVEKGLPFMLTRRFSSGSMPEVSRLTVESSKMTITHSDLGNVKKRSPINIPSSGTFMTVSHCNTILTPVANKDQGSGRGRIVFCLYFIRS